MRLLFGIFLSLTFVIILNAQYFYCCCLVQNYKCFNMKANVETSGCVERESRRAVAVLLNGGVHKKKHENSASGGVHGKKGEENTEEMKEYLGKLQKLVPFMPKNKRLSKLEVISHVIDYIHDLRETLGLPPCQQSEMDCADDVVMDADQQDTADTLVFNQTFKVSLVKEKPTSSSDDPQCDTNTITSPVSRLPLTSISSPRNTDQSNTTTSSDDNSAIDNNNSN